MPTDLPLLTADTLLTADQVAAALRWQQGECRIWLKQEGIGRQRPDGQRTLFRWGDVLDRMPMERERAPAVSRRRRTLRKKEL